MSGEIHIVPVGDLRNHSEDRLCWCRPRQDDDEPAIWFHNSMDRREHTIEKGIMQ